jgi:hypothetical protein
MLPIHSLRRDFVHEEVNSNSRFVNIGAYLMKDSVSGIMLSADSTTKFLAKCLREHLNSSKLKSDSENHRESTLRIPMKTYRMMTKTVEFVGRLRNGATSAILVGIGWEEKNSKQMNDLFE